MRSRIESRTGSLGAVALLLLGCTGAKQAEPEPGRPVRVERVAGETAAAGLRYSAIIQPYEQVSLAFKTGGYVREVRQQPGLDGGLRSLQPGDHVSRGMVLARIHVRDYQERVNQAGASLADARASLAKAKADGARADALYRDHALTRPDYEAAQARLESATAAVDAGRAQLEQANLALQDGTLVAPSDGVVMARNVEVGALVGTGSPGYTLADLTRVKAVFGVPDRVVRRVALGSRIALRTDALGGTELTGAVTGISPSADAQSRVFNVEVTIPNPEQRLRPGMIATVEVAGEAATEVARPAAAGAPMVAVAAIVKASRPGGFAVFAVEGPDDAAVARLRDVELGRISGNHVAVERGLALGDRVVVSGASLLVDGERIRVIPGEGL